MSNGMWENRLAAYISSLEQEFPEPLEKLAQEAINNHVPIIRKEAQSFLRFLMRAKKPKRILEIGTAVGFSASLMSMYMPKDATIVTVEKMPARIEQAKKNFALLDTASRITLMETDAFEALQILEKEQKHFDFVFLDAAKGQYINMLLPIMNVLSPGALLLTDNIFQEGSILESKFTIDRRDRTIHMRMRKYLYALKHTEGLETVLLPIGDGMAISTFDAKEV